MVHFAGLDVSVKATSVCVVDDTGKVILEQTAPTEPVDIIAVLTSLGVTRETTPGDRSAQPATEHRRALRAQDVLTAMLVSPGVFLLRKM